MAEADKEELVAYLTSTGTTGWRLFVRNGGGSGGSTIGAYDFESDALPTLDVRAEALAMLGFAMVEECGGAWNWYEYGMVGDERSIVDMCGSTAVVHHNPRELPPTRKDTPCLTTTA